MLGVGCDSLLTATYATRAAAAFAPSALAPSAVTAAAHAAATHAAAAIAARGFTVAFSSAAVHPSVPAVTTTSGA